MAIEVVIETDIARPPAVGLRALADVERWPDWLIASGIVARDAGRRGARRRSARA